MPSRVGSIVALPCHVVRSMERIGTRLPGAPGRKTWGIDTGNKNQRSPVFPPWTVTRDVWPDALRPDVSGVAVDALLFHEAGSRLVHRYRVYRDPFPHPALRDGVIPRLLSSVCRAMAIARLTLHTVLGCAAGKSSGVVFSGCGDCCHPTSSSPRVIRSRRQYTVRGGRFTGVVTD